MYKKAFTYLIWCWLITVFSVSQISAQKNYVFMGVKLRPEVKAYKDEIERKTKRKIIGVFDKLDEDNSILGLNFIHRDGTAYIGIRRNLKGQSPKLKAVIAHEMLHLRLRVRGYPNFLWSRKVKTKRGLAQDVEQSNVNDLLSIIEHQIFNPELKRLGLIKFIDFSKEAIQAAKEDAQSPVGQAQTINYLRGILEFQNPKDLRTYRKIFMANGWQSSIRTATAMARIIKRRKITTPAQVQGVMSLCLIKLYKTPRALKFRRNLSIKHYRQMYIMTK